MVFCFPASYICFISHLINLFKMVLPITLVFCLERFAITKQSRAGRVVRRLFRTQLGQLLYIRVGDGRDIR